MKNNQTTKGKENLKMAKTFFAFSILVLSFIFLPLFSTQAQSSFTTSLTTTGAETLPPSIPTNLLATGVSHNQVDLSWTASDAGGSFYSIAGYRIFRDLIFLATTTSTVYSDMGLTPLTEYSYTVEAFDTAIQLSGQSATSTATTAATPVSTPPPGGGSGGGSTSGLGIKITDIKITPGVDRADISFKTNIPTQVKIQWGFSKDFEIGSLQNLFYGFEHAQVINGLSEGLTYQVRITATGANGSSAYEDTSFITNLPVTETGALPNPSDFIAEPKEEGISLTWVNPTDSRFNDVRIVKAEGFYPIDEFDGVPIYEGDGESFVDKNVEAGVTYYYAIFARDGEGQYSSGALAQARLILPGEEDVVQLDPFINIPQATDVDPMIKKLTLADFEFIQDNRNLSIVGETIAIDGNKNLTIRLKYDKVPEILKTVAFTLQDPKEKSKVFPFLLRINDDKTYYEATIGALGRSGRYGMSIVILDYENKGLMRLGGTVAALAFSAPIFGLEEDFDVLGSLILLLVGILIILAIALLRNWVNRHPENVAKPKTIYSGPAEVKMKRALSLAMTIATLQLIASAFLFYPSYTNAAFNPQINYQGKLVNSSNVIVTDGDYNVRFKLYTSLTGGSPIWTETWCNTSDCAGTGVGTDDRIAVTNGLFSTMLGSTTALTGIDFDQPLYLGVEIGGSGATASWDGEMSPRKIIGAVPAALVARSANTLSGLNSTQFFRTDAQNATSSSSTFLNVLQTGAGKVAEFFGSASQSVMALLSNGNVGIGTTSPYAKLSVAGDVVADYFQATSTTATSTFAGGLSVAGTTGLTVLQNGNVGIGTTTSNDKLTLVGGNFSQKISGTQPSGGYVGTVGIAWGVYVSGKYAYVADQAEGLQIFDITKPLSPVLVGAYDTPDTAYNVHVSGKYAYIADGSSMQVVDISRPSSPTLVSSYALSGLNRNIYVSGKYVYIISDGIKILDVSDPSSPVLVGSYVVSGAGYTAGYDIYVSGKYAYVADYNLGFKIFDVSNPSSPSLTGSLALTSNSLGVYALGKYAYVANASNGLQIIDVSNPASPTVAGVYDTSSSAWAVGVIGNYALVADNSVTLQIIDVSSSTAPSLVGSYDTFGNATDIAISGKYAYVASGSVGLAYIDVNGIDTPMISSGSIATNMLKVSGDTDLANNLYVGNGLGVGLGGILSNGSLSISGTSTSYIAGNLGIGTTSPYAKLSVAGQAVAEYFTATSTTATSTFPNLYISNQLRLGSDYITDMTGTGLTLSGGALTVTGISISGAGNMLAGFDSSGNLTSTSSPQVAYINATSTTATSTFAGGLQVGGTTGLYVLQNGSVGVGTQNPSSKFEVVGDIVSKGTSWTARSAAGNNDSWRGITYGNGMFVAVGDGGDNVITSPDGINWTVRDVGGALLGDVTYGNGMFVAVGNLPDPIVPYLMYSSDGINWANANTSSYSGQFDALTGVTYGNGMFVAVSFSGNSVITSPDGINWTAQSATGSWSDVTYGNGMFVAVGVSGNPVMTSSDGINWTTRSAVGDNDSWSDVIYGNGMFVAVGYFGDLVMTSPDGINWTARSAVGNNDFWTGVTYGNGIFVAVGDSGDRVITSPDGINWTVRSATGDDDSWNNVTYGNGMFVAVGDSGDLIMTSGKVEQSALVHNNLYQGGMNINGNVGIGTTLPYAKLSVWGSNFGTNQLFELVDYSSTTLMSVLQDGTAYLMGDFGIGTTSPYAKLSVDGRGVFNQDIRADYFTAVSNTIASTFPYASTTALTVSGTNGLQLATGLNGPLQAVNGLVSATSTLSSAYGGTGLSSKPSYGQLLIGDGSGNYTLSGTSTLGILASSAIGVGSAGFIPFYTSSEQALTATSSIFIATSGFIGMGTTTPTSALSVFSSSAPQMQLAYNKDNFLTTAVSSSGGITLAVNGSLGGLSITNPQPTTVQSGAGTNAPYSLSVLGATGGNSLETNTGAGGNGGGIQLAGGIGGTATQSAFSETGGVGGVISVTGGVGGAASSATVDFVTRVAGNGGLLSFAGGRGGDATNGGAASSNTAGGGGSFILKGGAGGDASGATTNNGGSGGSLYLSGGANGTGSTLNGSAGNIYLGYDSSNQIGNVYFGNQRVSYVSSTGNFGIGTTSPYAKLSVAGDVVADYFHATSTTATSTFAGALSVGTTGVKSGSMLLNSLSASSKGFELKNGYWWDGAVGYLRPNSPNQKLAFDLMPNGTAAEVHMDICSDDVENDVNNWECLELLKNDNGSAHIGTKALGSGVVRDLLINQNGGNVTVGYSNGGGVDSMFALRTYNTSAGSSAFTSVGSHNGTNDDDSTRMLALGTGWSTVGGYKQDGGALDAGANLSGGLSIMARNANGVVRFYTGGYADENERAILGSTGNFGIGTTSPYAKLSVVGNVVADSFIATNTTAVSRFAGGLISSASTTIGNGTAVGGLTVSGGATTTGGAYFADYVNIDGDLSANSTIWTKGALRFTELSVGAIRNESNGGAVAISGGLSADSRLFLTSTDGVGTTDYIELGTGNNGSNIIRMVSSGNLGIGTTSPYAKLSVANVAGTYDPLFAIASSTASATTTLFTVLNSGNVGIGTANPSEILHILNDQDGDTRFKVENKSTGTLARAGTTWSNGSGAGDIAFLNITGNNYTGVSGWGDRFIMQTGSGVARGILLYAGLGGIQLSASGTNAPDFLVQATTGNVGIGTTSPYAKLSVVGQTVSEYFTATSTSIASTFPLASSTALTVSGSTYLTGLSLGGIGVDSNGLLYSYSTSTWSFASSSLLADNNIFSGANTFGSLTASSLNLGAGVANMLAGFDSSGNLTSTSSPQVAYINATSTTATSTFSGGLQAGGSTGLYVLQNGNVGIGTTSPYAKLSIANVEGSYDPLFTIASSTASATTTLFTVLNSGNVGIETANPGAKLDVYSTTYPVYRATRETSATNGFSSTNIFVTKSTGDVTDGFGGGLVFGLQDNTQTTDSTLASIGAVRNGADNSGALVLNTYNTGTFGEKMRVTATGKVGIGSTTPWGTLSITAPAQSSTAEEILTIGVSDSSTYFRLSNGSSVDGAFLPVFYGHNSADGRSAATFIGASSNIAYSSDLYPALTFNGRTTTGTALTAVPVVSFSNLSEAVLTTWYDGRTKIGGTDTLSVAGEGATRPTTMLDVIGAGSDDLLQLFDSTTSRLIVKESGNVGIGTTSPWRILSINGSSDLGINALAGSFTATSTTATSTIYGFLDVLGTGTNATSTFESNLWVKGNLRAGVSYVGDLFFANNFSFTESLPINNTDTQGIYLKNQNGQKILSVDDKGNLNISGDICSGSTSCISESFSKLNSDFSALASSTADLQAGISGLTEGIVKTTTSSVQSLADAIVALDLRVDALIASSTMSTDLTASTSIALASDADFISKISSSTANVLDSDDSFIQTLADAVKNVLVSAQDWVVERFTAKVAYINRVEAETVAIAKGMEIVDQVSRAVWCVTISNGDWKKIQGSCSDIATSTIATQQLTPTTPIATPVPVLIIQPSPSGVAINSGTTTESGEGTSSQAIPSSIALPEVTPTPSPTVSTSTNVIDNTATSVGEIVPPTVVATPSPTPSPIPEDSSTPTPSPIIETTPTPSPEVSAIPTPEVTITPDPVVSPDSSD